MANRETRRDILKREGLRVVVLDDDPTGVQTVHGCLMLTEWSMDNLADALNDHEPYFYILTNTRAFPPEAVAPLIRTIAQQVLRANQAFQYRIIFVSRSDSTLRSHFPLELETLIRTSSLQPEVRFLIPAFFEGNRMTSGDTHYILQDGVRVPCHETEFARDPVFGYTTSHLPAYIEEKTQGRVRRRDVSSLSQGILQPGRTSELDRFLQSLRGDRYAVVNAETYEELDRFSASVVDRLVRGDTFLFQSAASFVKSLVECSEAAPIGRESVAGRGPGLIIVGSHVSRTTRQVELLRQAPGMIPMEVDVKRVLSDEGELLLRTGQDIARAIDRGRTPVIYTSRSVLSLSRAQEQLSAGQRISGFLSRLVKELATTPGFLIAKGGITSHDVLVQGLGVRRARVLGQAAPGVPVIRMPAAHRWAGMPFVIFPGNVGEDHTLGDVVRSLSGRGPNEKEASE